MEKVGSRAVRFSLASLRMERSAHVLIGEPAGRDRVASRAANHMRSGAALAGCISAPTLPLPRP